MTFTMAQTAPISAAIFIIFYTCSLPYLAIAIPKDDAEPSDYSRCAPFRCGGINFTFPFSDSTLFGSSPLSCGLQAFQIICDAPSGMAKILLSNRLYQVKALYPNWDERAITVVDTDLIKDLTAGSCASLQNLTINTMSPVANLTLPLSILNFTFLQCPERLSISQEFPDTVVINRSCSDGKELYVFIENIDLNRPTQSAIKTSEQCRLVTVPIADATSSGRVSNISNESERWEVLLQVLNDGFPLTWPNVSECVSCEASNGRCGYDSGSRENVCFQEDSNKKKKPIKREVIIGIASGSSSLVLAIALVLLILFRKQVPLILYKSISREDQHPTEASNAESFIKTYQSTLVRSYSYKEIKKMTNAFKEKLGEGGYSNVYKGKLSDGRIVAVKMLDKSNHDTQDFVNEVSTVGTIHHFSIIRLLGFYLEGSKQALVYEFMPNGSLGDMLHKEQIAFYSLGMERLLEIAIGIAHGIEYLHIGCGSRILHLDIKPQNILLDQDFNPKISDFGLAKMYSRNKSAITMTGARGTIGFIAPEVFMRNLGNPSHKSDVYSFGMVLLEMIGSRKHRDQWNTSKSTEQYFPGWIYEKLNEDRMASTEGSDMVVEEESCISRKMIMVGLWCIQVNPVDRPSMTKVVEMLTGAVEAIEMPPKPYFFSPPRVNLKTQNNTSTDIETSSLSLRLNCQEYG